MLSATGNTTGYHRSFYCTVLLFYSLLICASAGAQEGGIAQDRLDQLIIATCYTCHSADDQREGAIPSLHGLSAQHINELLRAYKTGREQGTIMNRISAALTEAEIDRISAILGRQERQHDPR